MSFKTGNLARPMTVVKKTPDVVLDANLSWQGPFEHVFAKLGSENRRSIEAVCAWIGQDGRLPCPEPRFGRVTKQRLPTGVEWPFGDASEVVVFATIAIEGARQLTRIDSALVSSMLLRWESLELAGVFDQLIANDDRSDGNVLMDPRGGLWLIDHGRSLGGGGQRFFSSDTHPSTRNFFLDKIAQEPLSARMKRKNALLGACFELVARVPRIPYKDLLVPDPIAIQIDSFLSQRANSLQAMVLDAVHLPDMYQGGAEVRGPQ